MMSRLAQRRKNKLNVKPQKKVNLKKILKFIVVTWILIFMAYVIVSAPKLIKITKINCVSQYGPCYQKVDEVLDSLENNNFFQVRSKLEEKLGQNLYVESYKYNLRLPQTIDVEIKERKSQTAVVKQSEITSFYLMDEGGLIIEKVDSSILPTLLIKQDINFSIGDKLPESVIFAAAVLKQVSSVYNIKVASLNPDGIEVEQIDGKTVIFPLTGELDELFGGLSLILSRLNSELNVSKIDLRFKNPVLN